MVKELQTEENKILIALVFGIILLFLVSIGIIIFFILSRKKIIDKEREKTIVYPVEIKQIQLHFELPINYMIG